MNALYAHDPFLMLQGLLVSTWLDAPMAALTVVSQGLVLALLTILLCTLAKRDLRRALASAWPLLLAILFTGALTRGLKLLVEVPRPLCVLGPARVHVVLETLYLRSFPSGHAASVAALAASASTLHGGRARWLWVLALLGGISRVYVGAHWTTDVVAGWLVGAATGLLVALAYRWLEPDELRRRGGD